MLRALFLFITSLICAYSYPANAQQAESVSAAPADTVQVKPRRYYMDIQGIQGQTTTRAFDIKFVAGELFHTYSRTTPADLQRFRDKYKFTTLVDALNMMSLFDWQLSNCYTTAVNGTVTTHWIISKEVTNAEELRAGLITKEK